MADTNNEVKDTTTMDTTANQNPEPAVPASDKKEEKPEPTVQELMVEIAKLRREKDKNASEAADWKKKFRETQSAEEKASAEMQVLFSFWNGKGCVFCTEWVYLEVPKAFAV